MKTRLLITCMCVGLTIVAPTWGNLQAQDDNTLVVLTSPDPAHAVQFQQIVEGERPVPAAFVSALELQVAPDDNAPLVYVSVFNTGWSEGVIGLSTSVLDADTDYVALEIDADGVPRAGGLAFEGIHDADLGDEGGLTLLLLIAQAHRFGIFEVVDDGDLVFEGWTNQREDDQVTQVAVTYTVAPVPVLNLHLDAHIVATAATPPAAPGDSTSPDGAPGEGWGACGSCDSCGYPAEQCVLSPDGACIWDPGRCSAQTGAGAVGDLPEGCYRLTIIIEGGHGSVARSPLENCGAGYRWGTHVHLVPEAWGDWEVFGWITDCWEGESVSGPIEVVMNFDCTARLQFYKP